MLEIVAEKDNALEIRIHEITKEEMVDLSEKYKLEWTRYDTFYLARISFFKDITIVFFTGTIEEE